MLSHFRPAVVLLVLFTALTGLAYPLALTGVASVLFPLAGRRRLLVSRRQGGRLGADRPEFHQPTLFPAAAFGDQHARPQGFEQDDRRAL